MQVWGLNGELQSSFGTLPGFTNKPFDPEMLHTDGPIFRDTRGENGLHLRVLSIPLQQRGHTIGVSANGCQPGGGRYGRRNLTDILTIIWIVAVLFSAIVVWFTLGQTLKPLEAITETVEQINRADDLSRRIPYQGPEDDEIGSLVGSFNQTLERLEALFTSQQRLLADVSHELRTPLTVIKGNVDLMRRMKSLDEESLTSIDQEAGRLTRLVGGLLLLAQAESGKLALSMKRVELDLLLTEVFQEMSILAGNKVHLRLNEIDQAYVNGDRDRLKQVFINLVANAIQYTPQGGDVFLSLEKIGNRRASSVGTPARASLPKICLTSSSASIAPKSHARAERPQALAWVSPLRTGLWNVTGEGSKSTHKKERDNLCDLVAPLHNNKQMTLELGNSQSLRGLAAKTGSIFLIPLSQRGAGCRAIARVFIDRRAIENITLGFRRPGPFACARSHQSRRCNQPWPDVHCHRRFAASGKDSSSRARHWFRDYRDFRQNGNGTASPGTTPWRRSERSRADRHRIRSA